MTTETSDGIVPLDTETCWRLLTQEEVGRLAVSVGRHPDLFPLNYIVDGDTLVFRTAEGAKLAALAIDSAVAFEIDGYDASAGEAWSVVVKGRAHEIDMQQRARVIVFVAADRLTGDPVDTGQPVDPAADQHRVHGRG